MKFIQPDMFLTCILINQANFCFNFVSLNKAYWF